MSFDRERPDTHRIHLSVVLAWVVVVTIAPIAGLPITGTAAGDPGVNGGPGVGDDTDSRIASTATESAEGIYNFELVGSHATPAVHIIDVPVDSTPFETDVGTVESRQYVLREDEIRVTFDGTGRVDPNDVDHIEWTVSGPATVDSEEKAATLRFTDTGTVTVDATVFTTDGSRYDVASTDLQVLDQAGSSDRFTIQRGAGIGSRKGKIYEAYLNEVLPTAYRQIDQRTNGLPSEVTVRIMEDPCGGVSGCATGNTEIALDPDVPVEVVRHELAHLAQYKLDSGGYSRQTAWGALIEGHAQIEEQAPVTEFTGVTDDGKPPKSVFLNWNEDSYAYAEYFVLAIYDTYGMGKIQELLRYAGDRSFTSAFRIVMGESFDSFYKNWDPPVEDAPDAPVDTYMGPPTQNMTDVRILPMFVYRNGTLQALGDAERLATVSIAWDIDDDDTYERTGQTVNWTPESTGTYSVTLRYTNDSSSLTRTQTFSVSGPGDGCDYTGVVAEADTSDDCAISTAELNDAITAWSRGDYTTADLQAVIAAWASS